MKFCFVMRGASGSGKSSTAEAIARKDSKYSYMIDGTRVFVSDTICSTIHSTDFFRYVGDEYVFEWWKSQEYHDNNFENFKESIDLGIETVICDNTNIRSSNFLKYVNYARDAGYITSVVEMPHPTVEDAVERNIHNVPQETIEKMINKWDPYYGYKDR